MLWIRLYNDQGVSRLVNFGNVMLVTANWIYCNDPAGTSITISGEDQANIQGCLMKPDYGVSELKCEGSLAIITKG